MAPPKFRGYGLTPYQTPPPWAAANGGVTNGSLKGVWHPFLEIGLFQSFVALLRPFPDRPLSTWEISKTQEKGLCPKPPSLKLPFAAPHQPHQ